MNIKQIIITMFFVLALEIFATGQTIKQNAERQNSTPNNETPEIKKILEKWLAARDIRDQTTLEQLISDDYKLTTPDGKVFNNSQLFSESKLAEINLPTASVSSLKIEIEGDMALVTFISKTNSTNKKLDG